MSLVSNKACLWQSTSYKLALAGDKLTRLLSSRSECEKGQINTSTIESICSLQENNCVVTGLDISMQKKGSKFINSSAIKFYKESKPNTYKELEKRLSKKWKNASLEKRIEEIAHSVRNEYFNKLNNPRNNTKRSINKLLLQPSLFDNTLLINKEKMALAGININQCEQQ